MTIDKKIAARTIEKLDAIGLQVEQLRDSGKINAKVASAILSEVDGFADKLQVAAFGEENFNLYVGKVAKVLKRDPDEKFMDTFDNPNKAIQTDPDEEFMHKVGPSFNSKGIDTYDSDNSSAVVDRDEYAVRDLNEYAGGTKKQPSWAKGPAGKSTKQGSTQNSSQATPKDPPKTWSP